MRARTDNSPPPGRRAVCLTVPEAAKAIGISTSTLYRLWQADQSPPRVRLGVRWVVPARLLVAWIEAQVTK